MTYVSRPNSRSSNTRISDLDVRRRRRVGMRLRNHLPVELHRSIDRYTDQRVFRTNRFSRNHIDGISSLSNLYNAENLLDFANNFSIPALRQGNLAQDRLPISFLSRIVNSEQLQRRETNRQRRLSYLSNQRHLRAQIRSNVGRRNLNRF